MKLDPSGVASIVVALIVLVGTFYTGRQSRAATTVTAFKELVTGLQAELKRVQEECAECRTQLKDARMDLADATAYLRLCLSVLERHNIARPPVPSNVDRFPWED